jgi:hypothetical protein
MQYVLKCRLLEDVMRRARQVRELGNETDRLDSQKPEFAREAIVREKKKLSSQ